MTPAGATPSDLHRGSIPGDVSWLRRVLIGVAVSISLVVTGVIGTNAWLTHRATGLSFTDISSVPARDVVIVPGSRVSDGKPSPVLRARLEAALALYRKGRVRTILVSGTERSAAPEVSVMRAWLHAQGVPEAHILSDEGGSRTRETMNRAAELYDVRSAILCTQTVNMARTLFLARAAGIDAVGVALPTYLSWSKRYLAVEAFKTTLAVMETALRHGPIPFPADRAPRAELAQR